MIVGLFFFIKQTKHTTRSENHKITINFKKRKINKMQNKENQKTINFKDGSKLIYE
ncbi:Hypothetical Protein SLY_1029 [Strawberry lethal yellows phytoplasma (CPA) str. NZSb11]|uniref:Uncharacterized protein n=1 Tax=Strawberry lethal yellows phytoplasma (CPA) str. NZSb11 TaxID=980422 RepID=R4S2D5_PHYAS|nr:Hypothetical Protein SLY_1029 [Strawberry lethal yellows phytoplasma (CPA) str. NZSb11]